jgi:hypothetical protein
MRFDPELQEYVPQNPVVDGTTANIVGGQNPMARPQELELGAEVASGARRLSSLSYTELMQLDDLDLGHQTNKMVISEMLARHEEPQPPDPDPPSCPNVDSSLAKGDTTAEDTFKSDYRNKFKNDRRNEGQNDRRNKERDDSQNDRRNR